MIISDREKVEDRRVDSIEPDHADDRREGHEVDAPEDRIDDETTGDDEKATKRQEK